MWILKPQKGVWHYYHSPGPRVGLCGAKIADSPEIVEQEGKPTGFHALLCNRCWFSHELNRTLVAIPDESTRDWIGSLEFGDLSESDRERLYAALGEDRADSLLVIYSLAASSEPDIDKELPTPPLESVRMSVAELVAIPLAIRAPAAPKEPEPSEEECEESPQPAEPRMKVNYSRRPPERNGTGGIGGFLRRITERA